MFTGVLQQRRPLRFSEETVHTSPPAGAQSVSALSPPPPPPAASPPGSLTSPQSRSDSVRASPARVIPECDLRDLPPSTASPPTSTASHLSPPVPSSPPRPASGQDNLHPSSSSSTEDLSRTTNNFSDVIIDPLPGQGRRSAPEVRHVTKGQSALRHFSLSH